MAVQEITRPASAAGADRGPSASSVKSILVHIQNEGSATQRIEAALAIARATSAHLTCLHVTPIEAYVAFDSFGGVFVMSDAIKAIDEEVVRLREQVEDELSKEDVSWDYIETTGHVATEIVRQAALADLVVTGREPQEAGLGKSAMTLLGDLLQSSRTPLFIPGEAPVDPAGPALIAWDGSYEAANAVRMSLGLLRLASSVRVLHMTDKKERSRAFPGTRLLEYLSRHGVHAELVIESLAAAGDDEFVAAGLLSRARALGGAYVVMGGYSHSRLREYLFGGVTRTMLREATMPIVIAR
jgi:nucleotide-binding universal stress UspA family protein